MGNSQGRVPQASWPARAARSAVPALLVGFATTGIVLAAAGSAVDPNSARVPAASVVGATAEPQSLGREQRTSRSADAARAALSEAVQEKADKIKAAKMAAVKAKAAKAKAARAKAEAEVVAKAKVAQRARTATRAAARARAKAAAEAPTLTVVDTMYSRVYLNVRARNRADSRLITVLNSGSKVAVTRTVRGGWRYISYRGAGGWVRNQYLVQSKPKPKARAAAKPEARAAAKPKARAAAKPKARAAAKTSAGISGAACAGGSRVERGLTPDAVRVHRAICARFPSVKAYGGVRADSLPEHPSGRALDAMIPDRGTGWAIANYVRANAKRLGVSEVLFDRRIWTVQRSGEGWRTFPDRGSVAANHQDHVHVSVYGDAGG